MSNHSVVDLMHSPELRDAFVLEAEEHLERIGVLLPQLRGATNPAEAIDEIRRRTHSIKGAAAMVGMTAVADITHRMEDFLDELHNGRRRAGPLLIEGLINANDAVAALVRGEAAGEPAARLAQEIVARLSGSPVDSSEAVGESRPEAEALTPASEPTPETLLGSAAASVRVAVSRIEALARMVGDLTITHNFAEESMSAVGEAAGELEYGTRRLSHALAEQGNDLPTSLRQPLGEIAGDLDAVRARLATLVDSLDARLRQQRRLFGEVERELTRIRMVGVGSLSGRLRRVVRGTALEVGKEVELSIEGEDVEIDKAVIEQLADPLMHLARNAVDHGIEPSDLRQLMGKPPAGSIALNASFDGTQVVLRLRDDGAGIDPEMIRNTAMRTGRVSESAARAMSDGELRDLLFSPGFSTAKGVTKISGRGVGLDVVRDTVRKLRGTVTLTSERGAGTELRIALPPTTMSTAPAVLVKARGETFALLLTSVLQILRYERSDLEQAERAGFARWAGSTCPLIGLGRALSLKQPANLSRSHFWVLILRVDRRRIALVVEELIGQRDVMVMSLGSHLGHVPGIAGATLMPNGSVVLILNPSEIASTGMAKLRSTDMVAAAPPARQAHRVMVVDDSLSVRRSLSSWIRNAGWECVTARDGLAALAWIEGRGVPPDVLVVDDDMPKLGGFQLMAALQAQSAYRDVPVLIHASRSDAFTRRWAIAQGAAAFVAKPCRPGMLLTEIRNLMKVRTSPAR